ncbi:MAG: Planctomycete cytochrome, partial [Armatimonadetes bacterium]|nr:Planctomycete cytochrome [Armatimonadota bacterium]
MAFKAMQKSTTVGLTVFGTLLAGCVIVPLSGISAELPKGSGAQQVDFDRDVRPILSENCFACHGPDEKTRKAGLRLDTAAGALQVLKSGKHALVAGDPAKSELLNRVLATNALKMPPDAFGKTLKPAQVETLRRWIAQGGKFEKEGMRPSPVADRYTLIRRVTLDLTGLPPTPAEVNAFIADQQPGAYERVVDRLLTSPHYGEKMALKWLDLARYADTHGYHIDSHRDMWPWRDWVIEAYNKNMPFDQFTVEQLAGDLLPNPTLSQRIATGFNRNHPINFEGGAIPEEYQTAYIADRIDTTSTTWMGLTLRCSQCHDHKYDPLPQKDYYSFYAFFNNVPENGLDGQRGNAVPFLKAPKPEQAAQLAAFDKKIAELDQAIKTRTASAEPEMAAWERENGTGMQSLPAVSSGLVAHYGLDEMQGAAAKDAVGPTPGGLKGNVAWAPGQFGGALKLDGTTYGELGPGLDFDTGDRFSYGAWVYPTSNESMTVVSRMDDTAKFRGWDLYLGDRRPFVHLVNEWETNAIRVNSKTQIELNKWSHLFVTYDGSSKAKGVKIYVNGKPADLDVTHDKLTGSIRATTPAQIGRRNPGALFKGMIDEVRIYDRALAPDEVGLVARIDAVRAIVATPVEKRSPEQKTTLARFYLENHDPQYRQLSGEMSTVNARRTELDNAIPTTMVMQELEKPRDTFLLIRGEYNQKGEKVSAGVPAALSSLPMGASPNRLALAKWLVDPAHPLTARVTINRFWEQHFGAGLVRTPENFGTQGERPTHPELLDWLSTEFIRVGWNVKAMQRMMVTSATYRQSSRTNPALQERDPENRLLARAPRLRLPADQALAVGGLLVPTCGGPSVKPYQPARLWEELAFGGNFTAQTYEQDHGDKLYRRSMYTFWKRTSPPPSLQAFDAPEREFCVVSRSVSNTPLQALVLMNDPTYVESSRKFAERLLTSTSASPRDRVIIAFRMALTRPPKPAETQALLALY